MGAATESSLLQSSDSRTHTSTIDPSDVYEPTDNPAFVSFLAADWQGSVDENATDRYYDSIRILGYQLMHAPKTKSRYPFLVAVTDHVHSSKRAQLEADGAIVVALPTLYVSTTNLQDKYKDQMEKLSFFNMYGTYGRMCYIDADHLILENIDGVFQDQAAQIQTTRTYQEEIKEDEPPLPATYLFAGHAEGTGHHLNDDRRVKRIQDPTNADYVNGGFWVFAPGREIYEYYMWVANHTDRWNTFWAEQNMLNYVHRRPGNMPWTRIQDDWDVISITDMDILRGSKAIHGHFWDGFWNAGLGNEIWLKAYDEMTWFYGNRTQ